MTETLPHHLTLPDGLGDRAELEVLTDEELAVLSIAETPVVTPYLSSIAPLDRKLALSVAFRGLAARGIALPPGEQTPDAMVAREIDVRADVMSIVTLRQAARAVVAMARTTAAMQDFVYLHVVQDLLLIEAVSHDGLHRFAVRSLDELAAVVIAAAIHPQAGDAAGPAVLLDPADGSLTAEEAAPGPVIEAAGSALIRCDLTVLTRSQRAPDMLGLFSAPGGSWLFTATRGSGEPVRFEPLAVAQLRARVAQALAPITPRARS